MLVNMKSPIGSTALPIVVIIISQQSESERLTVSCHWPGIMSGLRLSTSLKAAMADTFIALKQIKLLKKRLARKKRQTQSDWAVF